ncbi:unnamed protein product [Clonostachys rhizophaga]|uniref:Ankyrin repeat domain containing protein n=1 Tax=Clonostachys rhizophaga TaxID=160324 RepID=A0A9N9V2C1_9HYPO|nr:unnamed protein product [Clonostachys rhizophaga]
MAAPASLPPHRPDKEYSFLEALNIGPTSELSLVSQEKLGLSPTPKSPAKTVRSPPLPPLPSHPTPSPVGPDFNVTTPTKSEFASPKQNLATPRPTGHHSLFPHTNTYGKNVDEVKGANTSKGDSTSKGASTSNGVKPVTEAAAMAPSIKAQAQCLESCTKVTKAGDRISVRMLEYLTSIKQTHMPHGLDDLAHGFLSTCQVLLTIEAGLEECTRVHQFFPGELLAELDKKFRVCFADFQVLENMLSRVLESERKSHGAMGKMKRGLRNLFGDTDFSKISSALEQTRESLRVSALMFQWSLGDDKIESGAGIGYTGLAAALDRLDQKRSSTRSRSETNSSHHNLPALRQQEQPPLPPIPALQWAERSTSLQNDTMMSSDIRSPISDLRQWSATASSVHSGDRHNHQAAFDRLSSFDETMSHHTGSDSAVNDAINEELAALDLGSDKVVRLKTDPFTMPRWNPRASTGSTDGATLKSALASAIRARNHKLVEQLLDRGAPANSSDIHALIEAVKVQDVESVRLLLLFGADPNETDREGMTPLALAVEKTLLGAAVTLLKYGADPNMKAGMDQDSPVARAIQSNKVSLAHLLLMYGGDVTQLNSEGNTMLISAVNKKTPRQFIALLLGYGANPNEKSREGKTVLFEAITSARDDIVSCLLENEANPNLPGPKHMLWPATYQSPCLQLLLKHGADYKKAPGIMELAASVNNIESVRILLKAGVDPNAKKDGTYTPLCTSIRDNRPDIFHLLLNNGADPNTPALEYPCFKCITHNRLQFLPALVAAGGNLNSPKGILETAVAQNYMEAVLWLLDQGLDPNERNSKGHSPLTTAIRDNRVELVDLLIMRGADPNKRGEDWPVCMAVRNPPILKRILNVLAEPRAFKGVIERAVAADQLESVKLLLAAGVSVEDKNGGVFSPLTTALRENHRDIVRFLVDPNGGGADVNAPGEHLPVVKALRRFHGEDSVMLEVLLEHGADPNKMYRGWNGIFQAVENGELEVLQILKDKGGGFDLDAKDEMGRTAIEMASQRGWDEGVQILREGRRKQ